MHFLINPFKLELKAKYIFMYQHLYVKSHYLIVNSERYFLLLYLTAFSMIMVRNQLSNNTRIELTPFL